MSDQYSGTIQTSAGSTHAYRWRSLSVDRFPALQEEIDALRQSGLLAQTPAFTNYMNDLSFRLPENFPAARSLLLVATSAPLMTIDLLYAGRRITVFMPPNYAFHGLTRAMLLEEIRRSIIPDPAHRVDRVDYHFFVKLAAVRSGLAQYGRNNICYVEGMGSFFSFHAYLTDRVFEEDHWSNLSHLPYCDRCSICIDACPTSAISPDRFVIDASRCIPLYNELEGDFPDWIPAHAHNSIIGCMTCQAACPANRDEMAKAVKAEDIPEADIRMLLEADVSPDLLQSLSEKLKMPYIEKSPEFLTVLRRNIRVLLE